jgi:hypothetical protein
MKRVIIALLLCFIFSSEIQAKKVIISSASAGTFRQVPATANICMYQMTSNYQASVHAHKTNALELRVLVGDEVQPPLYYKYFAETDNWTANENSETWEVDSGESWSMVWVLKRTKGKGHVIDAIEMESGTCNPLPPS